MKYYTIGNIRPLKKEEIKELEQNIGFELPEEYSKFLTTYGYGEINEFLMINSPDKDYFKLNFHDCLDLWELSKNEKDGILNGITIGRNIDGDIFLLISNSDFPFVVIPRHSEKITRFKRFNKLLEFNHSNFELDKDNYFDSYHDYEQKHFDLIINEKLDKTIIDNVHQLFLKELKFDKVVNSKQPKYIFQKMGGWVCFDLVYKRSIRVKYQKESENHAKEIIKHINSFLKL